MDRVDYLLTRPYVGLAADLRVVVGYNHTAAQFAELLALPVIELEPAYDPAMHGFEMEPAWTAAERAALADAMIARWQRFKALILTPAPVEPAHSER